ncbi:hypothetical protein CT0861_05936 [Colletotrichum tofieldiae]|uniref:Uncharacterized protein n=1 Tax=Colletotrichum tofieldiae TaxID=708197 RepID=A0A161YB30_9PEZI|nr:hypothetical protein CT0861_05936 [Colletotrichum tofieldiae]
MGRWWCCWVVVAGNLHTRASRHRCVPLLWDRTRAEGKGRMVDTWRHGRLVVSTAEAVEECLCRPARFPGGADASVFSLNTRCLHFGVVLTQGGNGENTPAKKEAETYEANGVETQRATRTCVRPACQSTQRRRTTERWCRPVARGLSESSWATKHAGNSRGEFTAHAGPSCTPVAVGVVVCYTQRTNMTGEVVSSTKDVLRDREREPPRRLSAQLISRKRLGRPRRTSFAFCDIPTSLHLVGTGRQAQQGHRRRW